MTARSLAYVDDDAGFADQVEPFGRQGRRGATEDLPLHPLPSPISVGDLRVQVQGFQAQGPAFICPAGWGVLVVPRRGVVDIDTGASVATSSSGAPFLHIGQGTLVTVGGPASYGFVVAFRRDRLNAVASRLFGDGRRLVAVSASLSTKGLDDFRGIMDRIAQAALGGDMLGDGAAIGADFSRALVGLILSQSVVKEPFTPVRAVSDAMRLVRERHSQPLDIDGLAALTGVTAQTLRKGFRACLGVTVKEFITAVRLDWAHARLASTRDSRSIGTLARLAGFSDPSTFTRSYAGRFGEPPSRTRAEAVRMSD